MNVDNELQSTKVSFSGTIPEFPWRGAKKTRQYFSLSALSPSLDSNPGYSSQNTNDVFKEYTITFDKMIKSFRCNLVEEKIHLNITGV
jgi:hypothetical protein